MNKIEVYLEVGSKRTFAAALDWPGWCRMGRSEADALHNLIVYAPRYAHILQATQLGFQIPQDTAFFVTVERLAGNATTDFGAPGMAPTIDASPLDEAELTRQQTILAACWQAFDAAIALAQGKTLRTGPRGGGRSVDGILQHVLGAELGYLGQLGGKAPPPEAAQPALETVRRAILTTLTASAHGEIAQTGPRGGKRWSPRYFVRRDAWHVLDHLWEIEDRLVAASPTGDQPVI